ncbi:F0F1 ATP synthase subunit gamma [Brucella abortus]|nr:F0F1 ATP synthase subunit gamma [Brucella abortus]
MNGCPSLKDLRNRIASVKATQKITKAMQMVAAAKLRRAQEAAEAARPYSQRMGAVLANIAQNVSGEDAPALMVGTARTTASARQSARPSVAFAAVSTRRSRVWRVIMPASSLAEGKTVKIITVGKKGADILRREFSALLHDHVDLREVKQLAFVHADQIGHKIIKLFEEGAFDVCTLFYSEFKSVISQVSTAQQLIPASADNEAEMETAGDAIYEYEPDPAAILSTLIPRNISVQIFRALLENVAGEMGAKMSAMDNATRNAGDMIKQAVDHV